MRKCTSNCNPSNVRNYILDEIKLNRVELECVKYNIKYVHDKKIIPCIADPNMIISTEILPKDEVTQNDLIYLINNGDRDGVYKVLNCGSDFDYSVLNKIIIN